jgi:hypothetical protein
MILRFLEFTTLQDIDLNLAVPNVSPLENNNAEFKSCA